MIYTWTNFARIVTDLPIFASSILIDKELGWELQIKIPNIFLYKGKI
jgi:hypothetical protein